MNSKDSITIIIADDHPMLLNGLYGELADSGYNVLGKALDGMQALKLVLEQEPMIALLDIDMPLLTGLEVVKMAHEKNVATKFVLLSFHKESIYISQAKSLNIDGYLLKEDSFMEIEKCIQAVLSGKCYFSSSFDTAVLEAANTEIKKLQRLSLSELKILKLIAGQNSNGEIAALLNVSIRTIEKHRSNIIFKLELLPETNVLTNWALVNQKNIMEQ
jgi:DNA-binding NarL/FixJ family response regulator